MKKVLRFGEFLNESREINEGKVVSLMQLEMAGKKIMSKIRIGSKFETGDGGYTVTGFGQQANAFKEFDVVDDEGNIKKLKLTVMYGTKIQVLDDPRSAVWDRAKEVKLSQLVLESVEEVDELPGGLADGKSPGEIAKKHDVSLDKIMDQLAKGIKVEMEHTNDEARAREISLDHLMEMPDYYDKLETVEENLNEGNHDLSKRDLDAMISDIKQELSVENMSGAQKYDMAQILVDGDQPMVDAIIKYYKVKADSVQDWLASRI